MNTVALTFRRWLIPLLTVVAVAAVSACDSNQVNVLPNVPVDHTAKNDGVPHKPGFQAPFATSSGCTNCHGADLTGGTAVINGTTIATPSCFSCHGALWNGNDDAMVRQLPRTAGT